MLFGLVSRSVSVPTLESEFGRLGFSQGGDVSKIVYDLLVFSDVLGFVFSDCYGPGDRLAN